VRSAAERGPEQPDWTSASQVTVVVPHYGDAAPTSTLVAELAAQVPTPVREIIVVDDASPVALSDLDGARVLRREANGGFGAAVNTGAAIASGELLLVLNSDVSVAPGFVADLLSAAEPWQPAVAAPAVSDRGHPARSGRRFPTAWQMTVENVAVLARWQDRDWWRRQVGQVVEARPGADVLVDWLAGAALLVPTRVFREAGGFDERYFMYAEEVDLQRRLADLGLPRVHLGSVVVEHEGGASTDPARRREWLLQARLMYSRKWGGLTRLRCGLSSAVALNLATDGVRRALGRDVEPWRTARSSWRAIWRRRDLHGLRAR
jgi:N-acetylglucosaminyl-diphospho-decaprenol L-rhamnosyltransferase